MQASLGLVVAVVVLALSLTGFYRRAELVTYDWRFHLRNSLVGVPPIDPRLGTIEIDDQSVEAEGRFQDWTREKYADVLHLLHLSGARLVGFDVYFIEPSARVVAAEQLLSLPVIDRAAVEAVFSRVDADRQFEAAIRAAGNVYLALYLGIVNREIQRAEAPRQVEARDADEELAYQVLRARAPRLMVPAAASTLNRAHYIEPPLRMLREAARGFAYAQTVPDLDGARRRFPLVYQYEDVVLPSIALSMVCDLLDVPLTAVEVRPGRHVRLPQARLRPDSVVDIEIPIDQYGNMDVNWAGRWEETFARFSHIALRRAYLREQRQARLEALKEIVAADAALAGDRRALLDAMRARGLEDEAANERAVRTWYQARMIEAALHEDPALTAAAFYQSRGLAQPGAEHLSMFAAVAGANRVAAALERDPHLGDAELLQSLADADSCMARQWVAYVRARMGPSGLLPGARPLFCFPYVMHEGKAITPESLRGKVLFYGQNSTGSTDLSVVPFQGDFPMVGIYSNVLNTILHGSFIRRPPSWSNAVLLIVLGVFMGLVVTRLRVLQGALVVGLLLGAYALTAVLLFAHLHIRLELVGPLAVMVGGYLVVTIYGYLMKEREKEFVQGAFGHYLSPAVVQQIVANPTMVEQLGGEERVMTAFFSDIASFSTISECLSPSELVRFINVYLTEMCAIIESYGGTIDKFEGDAIIAFFGAPIYLDDHARRAVLACIDQQRRLRQMRQEWAVGDSLPPRLQELRQQWEQQGRVFAHVRMGITAGPMVVGNMGSRTRVDYTMMGDTVNLASRFESAQKMYGTSIMANDAIHDAVADEVVMRRLDFIQVVGKVEPVTAYEILERKGELDEARMRVLELYNRGLELYDRYEFGKARELFLQALAVLPSDGPSALYADRCEEYAQTPPADLVFRARTK